MSSATIFLKLDIEASPQDFYYSLKGYSPLVFLDSSLESEYSLHSYIGFGPKIVLESYGYRNRTTICGKLGYTSYQHPIAFMQEGIDRWADKNGLLRYTARGQKVEAVKDERLPDFCGGFMGYLAYDLKDHIEKLPRTADDDYHMPIIYLAFFDKVFAYSHKEGHWYYIRNFNHKESPEEMAEKAREESLPVAGMVFPNDNFRKIIKKYREKNIKNPRLGSNFKKEDYMGSVKKAKKYIHEGEIYQVNISQRFNLNLNVEPEDLYYVLRTKNSAPYSAFIKTPDFSIASTSPERFLLIKEDEVQTRPIKGTRPRGKDRRQDEQFESELRSSLKDRAELNMIVDLERNDLGKFCSYGSVRVKEHAVIEKYARVMHSVSTVTGKIKASARFSDIIKATFPGGSITGAPKIRSMQIIDELEPTVRSVYTGSIGYISIDGTVDLNIAIRTMIIKGNNYYYNVGGGIVEDSDPQLEYRETLYKGMALKETLKFFDSGKLKKL